MTIKDPFITEVVRIIKKRDPRMYGMKTIILVSHRFYDAAREEAETQDREIWGMEPSKSNELLVDQILALPVSWLSDYGFEIRPQIKYEPTP